jgi:hypothetical protein
MTPMTVSASLAARMFPCLEWVRGYDRQARFSDLTTAENVTVMLFPQSLV